MLYGVIFYLVVLFCFPVRVEYPVSLSAVAYCLACALFFSAGSLVAAVAPMGRGRLRNIIATQFSKRLLLMVISIAVVGVVFKVYDKMFIRGVSISAGFENREMLVGAGFNIFSVIGGMLYPFCYLPLFVYLVARRSGEKTSRMLLLVSVTLFFYPSFDALIIGSRSLLLVNITFLLLCALYFRLIRPTITNFMLLSFGVFSLFLLSANVFLQRLNYMGMSYLDSALSSAYAYTVTPSDWALAKLFNAADGIEFMFFYSVVNVGQYITHSFFEFNYLYENYHMGHTYGAYQFNAYYKLIAWFWGDSQTDQVILAVQPRMGIFTSFLGPVYTDFGWFGILYMFGFGFICCRVWRLCKSGAEEWLPLYFYFFIIIFFMPVVNFIASAQGLYVLTVFLAFPIMIRRQYERAITKGS